MDRRKVSIIGAGNVGATTAHWIASKGFANIVLYDIQEGMPQGKALDLLQSMPIENKSVNILGTNNFEDMTNSDIIVITAGIARKPGMSRDDLLKINTKIMEEVSENIKKHSPNSIVIVASNPLDAMVYKAWKTIGMPKNRIMGMAGILDSARFKTFLSLETGISPQDISTLVLGGHADTMVPVLSHTTISGIPIKEFLNEDVLNNIVERTRDGGAEIVKLLKTGSAYYAPARAITQMVESIILDERRILNCSCLCEGEYDAENIFLGVPAILGKNGVEKIVEIKLDKNEEKMMVKALEHIDKLILKV